MFESLDPYKQLLRDPIESLAPESTPAPRTPTVILIEALRVLASDIICEDGVATAAIMEAADRLEELYSEMEM